MSGYTVQGVGRADEGGHPSPVFRCKFGGADCLAPCARWKRLALLCSEEGPVSEQEEVLSSLGCEGQF